MTVQSSSIENDDSGFELPELPLEVLEQADTVCLEFERSWQRGSVTPIESVLQEKTGDERTWLLFHLLEVEVFYRSNGGDEPGSSEYERRFPEDRPVVREAFRRLRLPVDPSEATVPSNGNGEQPVPVRCPECDSHVPPDEVEPGVVTCQACGSTFVVGPDPGDSTHTMVIPESIGRYQIIGYLGAGAFGTVYLAKDPRLDTQVALKVPRDWKTYSAERQERFMREARAAARLHHPHIVQVYDTDSAEGVPFLVCGYIDGSTLAERLHQDEPIDPRDAALLVRQIAEALEYAHQQQIIHRDIKPGNILVSEEGCPYLTDFGLARRGDEDVTLTEEGQLLGTWAYMSPEQAAGHVKQVDARSDIYSLGVVLYELLTGQRPFEGKVLGIQSQILNDAPKPPRSIHQTVPRDLETICLKCMSKAREQRYQTAAELVADLTRFLNDEPIRARRAGRMERGWRWLKRNRALTALVVVTLLAMILAIPSRKHPAPPPPPPPTVRLDEILKEIDTIYVDPLQADAILRIGGESTVLSQKQINDLELLYKREDEFLIECLNGESTGVKIYAALVVGRIIFVGTEAITTLRAMTLAGNEEADAAVDALNYIHIWRPKIEPGTPNPGQPTSSE